MMPTIAVYAALSNHSYLYFLGKSHFADIYIYRKRSKITIEANQWKD